MEKIDRLEKMIEELIISQKKTNEQLQRTDEQLQKTDIRLNNLTKKMEGFFGNYGEATEEFFYRSLESKMKLGNITFDRIERRVSVSDRHVEYDIVLFNGEFIGIIEVKSKAHPKDVEELRSRKTQHYRIDYPEYSDHKLLFGLASMITNQDVIVEAKKEGIFLLTQKGDHIEILNNEVRAV